MSCVRYAVARVWSQGRCKYRFAIIKLNHRCIMVDTLKCGRVNTKGARLRQWVAADRGRQWS